MIRDFSVRFSPHVLQNRLENLVAPTNSISTGGRNTGGGTGSINLNVPVVTTADPVTGQAVPVALVPNGTGAVQPVPLTTGVGAGPALSVGNVSTLPLGTGPMGGALGMNGVVVGMAGGGSNLNATSSAGSQLGVGVGVTGINPLGVNLNVGVLPGVPGLASATSNGSNSSGGLVTGGFAGTSLATGGPLGVVTGSVAPLVGAGVGGVGVGVGATNTIGTIGIGAPPIKATAPTNTIGTIGAPPINALTGSGTAGTGNAAVNALLADAPTLERMVDTLHAIESGTLAPITAAAAYADRTRARPGRAPAPPSSGRSRLVRGAADKRIAELEAQLAVETAARVSAPRRTS